MPVYIATPIHTLMPTMIPKTKPIPIPPRQRP
jgi:hypothetical protein